MVERALQMYDRKQVTPFLQLGFALLMATARRISESEAFLKLPQDTLASRMEQWVGDGAAELDYRLKQQSRLVDDLIDVIGDVRHGLAGRAAKD